MADASGTTAFTYTPAGQLLSENGSWANDTVTNGYTQRLRTALGLAQPSDSWLHSYQYDPLDLRTGIARNLGGAISTVTVSNDAIGQLTGWTAKETNTTPLNEQLRNHSAPISPLF